MSPSTLFAGYNPWQVDSTDGAEVLENDSHEMQASMDLTSVSFVDSFALS